MTGVLIREGKGDFYTHRHRRRGHVKMEAEMEGGYKPRNAKYCQQPPEARREA